MSELNAISSLLMCAAQRYATHDSSIGALASDALKIACRKPIAKQPYTVDQCSALRFAYQQHESQLNRQIEHAQSRLHWNDTGSATKAAEIQKHLAFVELLGPTGMVLNNNCRVGLFLQKEQAMYPNHKHAAEELYLVVSGKALWSQSNSKPATKKPGDFIHHESWEPHAMHTTNEPLLAMWCWTGEIGFDTYEMMQT